MLYRTIYKQVIAITLCLFAREKLHAQKGPTDPFKIIKPLKSALHTLPLDEIKPGGWLLEELQKNMDGFTGHLDSLVPDLILQDDIYGKDRLSKKIKSKSVGAVAEEGDWQAQYLWWNSETQSNWLDGFLRTAVLLRDKDQLAKAERLINRLLSTQDADGYIGIYDKDLRYKFDNENGELWSKATLYRALLGWYSFKKDKNILAAIENAVQDVLKAYPINQSHPFYSKNPNAGGLTHGLAFTDVLEQLYALTNKKVYREYCLFMYKDFSEQVLNEDAQYAKLADINLPLKGHGVHTYEHLRSVIAAFYASGNPALKKVLDNFLSKIQVATTPSGGPAGNEFILGKTADASTGYEYCSLHELMAGWISLLEKSADIQYADDAEHLFFNAAAGNTHPTESAICYLKQDNAFYLTGGDNGDTSDKHQTRYRYSPVHKEAAVCCVPNAGRIVPHYIQHMWMKDNNSLVATLLGPSEVHTTINNKEVHVKEETAYPYENTLRFTINSNQPNTFSLKIRKPGWAVSVQSNLPYKEENGYLVYRQVWGSQTDLTISLQANIVKKETANKEVYFKSGPLVLCHEIKGDQEITKKFSIPGMFESSYKPVQLTIYQYDHDQVMPELNQVNRFKIWMVNSATGKKEEISLVPMAKTILRQVTFKKKEIDYTKYVNTFIGTEGTGHTFPGPCLPFGMVQPGPDNADIGWDYTSGYQFKDSVILGFSQTRANGTGINEFGDVLLQPFTDDRKKAFAETYDKATEKAYPGYYTVRLNNKVNVELTCTERVAFHQYTYPDRKALLLVDLQHGLRFLTDSLVLESQVKIENNTTITGYCHTRNWVDRKYFFIIQFNQPFTTSEQMKPKPKEAAPRFVLRFDLENKVLQTKIALSTVSIEGAKRNLQKELPGWDFDGTVANAGRTWNSYLNRIEIEAGQKQKEVFYSSMFRLFIQPSNITDVDGKYRGADDSIRTAKNGEYYSTLSLWDTFRAANPLYTLIVPERVNGFINTMIEHSKDAGFLPIWTAWGKDNYCMIGNHAIPVLSDAYLKGFTGFNADEALQQMIRSTTENHINSNWTLLNKYGYYPFDSLDNEAVSRTLEHGVDDYCIGLMAQKMGKADIAKTYFKRAAYYKNLYDSTTRQMRGKDSRGNWRSPFNPLLATSPMNNPGDYTEANAWQYFWTPALHDIDGMMKLLGGKKSFTAQLDSFFTIQAQNPNKHLGQEALIGQYAHGNEPSHHVAYLYAYSDEPDRGREIITKICSEFYGNASGGMIGNDDCGQMSAWYIFSTLGFYPVNPVSGEYIIGQPQTKSAIVHLKDGKILKITNNNTKLVKLNGLQVSDLKLSHKQVSAGGLLNF